MAVKTDSNEGDKNLVNTKEIGNKIDVLPIAKVDNRDDDPKTSAIQTTSRVETQPLIPLSITKPGSSKTVDGKVSVVGSENVSIGNNTYLKGPVRIKKLKQKVLGHKSAVNDDKNSQTTQNNQVIKYKSSENWFQIRRWHVNTLGSAIMLILGGILAVYFHSNTYLKGDSMVIDGAFVKTTGYFNVPRLFYENINFITLPMLLTPLMILLMANALQRFDHSTGIMKKKIDDMRPAKEVKTPIITPEGMRIVSRTIWHAEPVVARLKKIIQPVPWVIISHTATGGGNTQSECIRHVRVIQRYHKYSKGWDDIGYNFLVGGDGAVYCGRGWDHIGAHTLGYNRYSIGVAFIGTFNLNSPPKRQLEACKKLLQRGVALGKLSENYKIFGHRQLWAVKSPGDKLYDIIKDWPHFVKEFNDISELIPDY